MKFHTLQVPPSPCQLRPVHKNPRLMLFPLIHGPSYTPIQITFVAATSFKIGPGSSVGIANRYGLDGPGIEFRWGRDLTHKARPALRPMYPPIQWVPGLYRGGGGGGKRGGGGVWPPPTLRPGV